MVSTSCSLSPTASVIHYSGQYILFVITHCFSHPIQRSVGLQPVPYHQLLQSSITVVSTPCSLSPTASVIHYSGQYTLFVITHCFSHPLQWSVHPVRYHQLLQSSHTVVSTLCLLSINGGNCHKCHFCRDKTRLLSRQNFCVSCLSRQMQVL